MELSYLFAYRHYSICKNFFQYAFAFTQNKNSPLSGILQIRICNIHWQRPPFFRLEGQPLRKWRAAAWLYGFPFAKYSTCARIRQWQYLFPAPIHIVLTMQLLNSINALFLGFPGIAPVQTPVYSTLIWQSLILITAPLPHFPIHLCFSKNHEILSQTLILCAFFFNLSAPFFLVDGALFSWLYWIFALSWCF